MIFDFTYYNPTKIYFGKDSLEYLKDELKNYGNKVMLAYGFSSIKKIGLYAEVIKILKEAQKEIFELKEIMPNPTYEKLLEGIKIVKKEGIDLILAVGGGSVIDLSKGISVSAYSDTDPWTKYWLNKSKVDNKVVPLASILTSAATGSEMNGGSVITNGLRKKGRVFPEEVYPKFSILNPIYTMHLSEYQTFSGIADIFSHLMEIYFSGSDDNTSDYLLEGAMKSLIHSTEKLELDMNDYEARSNIMWLSTIALNNMLSVSKEEDWQAHSIEHQISAYTDCAHGMGLSAISPSYYKYELKHGLLKFKRFAQEIFKVDAKDKTDYEIALQGIDKLKEFFKDHHMVTNLKDLGVTKEMLPLIAESADKGGSYLDLTSEDVLKILEDCFE